METNHQAENLDCGGVFKGVKPPRRGSMALPPRVVSRIRSGKFQVRTTPEMRRQLAMQAAEAGVSLNRFINSRLGERHTS